MNRSSTFGVFLCGAVLYFGIVANIPVKTLLNMHAIILVIGGTIAIAYFSYTHQKLGEVFTFVTKGFFLKSKQSDFKMIEDLLLSIKNKYGTNGFRVEINRAHPFVKDSFRLLEDEDLTTSEVAHILKSRKDAVKRRYFEDAKILLNISKYPPNLGLLGAASGMIQMMAGLGRDGVETIGASMAVALTATLWGICLNNFVLLPLADNATKAAEDEMYFRNIVCESVIMLKDEMSEKAVTETVVSRLLAMDRAALKRKILALKEQIGFNSHAA